MLSDGNIITVSLNVSVARVFFQPSVIGKEASGVHDTSSRVDIRKNLNVNVVLLSGTTMFQGILRSMTKELTALSPSTMSSRRLLHQCENSQYGLEDLSCSSQHIPADVDIEGEFDDLAWPSSIGSASELTILTCRLSEQQCCLEIDSVSRFTGFRRGNIENLSSVLMNCFFFFLKKKKKQKTFFLLFRAVLTSL